MAVPLYVAVSTDTGCFVYGNTTADTHRTAAALMETGIPAAELNKRHFRTKTLKRLRIESRIVEGMELFDGGETAVAAVDRRWWPSWGPTSGTWRISPPLWDRWRA